METQKIKIYNELIAEFMGGIYESKLFPIGETQIWLPFHNMCYRNNLKYHSSWDWLMPVYHKIIGEELYSVNNELTILFNILYYSIGDGCVIEEVYEATINLLVEYNKHK